MPRRRAGSTIALDIGPDAIVVLQSSGTERAPLRRALVHPLPLGLVVDGEVVNADGLAVELQTLFSEHKLGRDVRVGLAHPRLMVRMVELPSTLDGVDLDGAVRHLAGDLLPVGLDQLVVDYRRVGNAPAELGGQQRVLMAAARVDGIERLTRALSLAGLRAERIQLAGLALLSALDRPPVGDDAILYVQAGALTNVVITEQGEPLLVRAASAGSEAIAAGLAERAEITHEVARERVAAVGVGRKVAATEIDAAGADAAEADADNLDFAAALQVREGLRRIVAEIQSSRGFYSARPDARPIGAVVLTGSMTTWPGVVEALTRELHLPVLPAGRDGWPELDGGGEIASERLDIAVGLAAAGAGQRPDLRPAGAVSEHDGVANAHVAQIACAMVTLLAAAVVYLVIVSNQVSTGREHVDALAGALSQAESQAAALKPYHDFANATIARRDTVASVAGTRFNWDRTLRQLAKAGPNGLWLTSAKGTLASTTEVDGGATDGDTAGLRAVLAAPALELAGCTTHQRSVPAYMDRLYGLTGVTDVGFSRSERVGKSGSGLACGDGAKGVRFSLVAYFEPSPAQVAAAAQTGSTTTSTAGTAATPATTTSTGAATPATTTSTPTAPATPAASAGATP
jgi:type IV pilus assembly protein PilM